MDRLQTNDRYEVLSRDFAANQTSSTRTYNRHHFLQLMNDDKRRAQYQNIQLTAKAEGMTVTRLYEKQEWADFVAPTFLDPVLENTSYTSVAENVASSITVGQGLKFIYREFENFQRAQRGAENTEFERKRGTKRLQEVELHTLGARSYITEEELADIPVDAMQMELRTMGASIALERDLLWVDSLHRATSGDNASTFGNVITVNGSLDVETLHLCMQYFQSPFNTDRVTPFADVSEDTERLMRIGKFRATDCFVSPAMYWTIVNTDYLKAQHIWQGSRILDTGELNVPLLGMNIHKTNIGYFENANDPDSWIATNDVYICDRRQGGTGTIGVRQPLQVRNWEQPSFRTQDFMIFERVGFAVQNRRALIRIIEDDPYVS